MDLSTSTWQINIKGIVQGVGFRPNIYRAAIENKLVGQVSNNTDGVQVTINTNEEKAKYFVRLITELVLPKHARLASIQLKKISFQNFENFEITKHSAQSIPSQFITPDLSLCADCKAELQSESNRRFQYPFISCVNCGPRYSILGQLPFERFNTSMHPFEMCSSCHTEFTTPSNRRFHAQTISCNKCHIQLSFFKSNGKLLSQDFNTVIQNIISAWNDGAIIAIKGIGGYLLTCDATNYNAIEQLRIKKNRPSKPFAVMFPNLAFLSLTERNKTYIEMLKSEIAPIVLTPVDTATNLAANIHPSVNCVGAMLPNAPIFQILLNVYNSPIIATSGNISKSPIVYKDHEALDKLSSISDFILSNNREILTPQDDSVVAFSHSFNKKIVIRRARGIAPNYIANDLKLSSRSIFAAGALQKSTFSLLHKHTVYISQYLGNIIDYDTFTQYKETAHHFLNLVCAKPTLVLCDLHPEYTSTIYAEKIAQKWNVPIEYAQHHKAHFGAIIGESDLIHSKKPVLGIVWDGMGLGSDEKIWGSEFFMYHNFNFKRVSHLQYYPWILGDKMAMEPRLSALSLCHDLPEATPILRSKFTDEEWVIYKNRIFQLTTLETSSMGRLFDAVASILGLIDVQTYEGEGAILLEELAQGYYNLHKQRESGHYIFQNDSIFAPEDFIRAIIRDILDGTSKEEIAFKFHHSLVLWINLIATRIDCNNLAFSGGVFQNGLLVDLILEHFSTDYNLYFHDQLSPNDENISFGQVILSEIRLNREKRVNLKEDQ